MLQPHCSATPSHIAYTQSDAECNKPGQVTWSSCASLNENLMMSLSCLCSSSALQNLNYSCNEGKSSELSLLPVNSEQPSPPAQPPRYSSPHSLSESWESFSRLLQAATSNQMAHNIKPIYLLKILLIRGGSGQQWTHSQSWLREESCW